jgi:putative DNA primase/helicase
VGDSETKVDAAAMVAEMKAEHAAKRKRFKEEYALADMEAKTTILAKPIDLPSAKVVPIKQADQKPKSSKDGKLKTTDIDVSEIEVPDVASIPAVPSKGTIDLRGTPLEKTMNALREFNIPFSYDLFHDQYLVGNRALQLRIGENIDHAILVLRTAIIKKFQFEPKPEIIRSAVYRMCIAHSFDPMRDYLDGLVWDGVKRIDTWLITYLGAFDDELNRAIGRKVLLAAVRRTKSPGTKFDQVLGLEGPEGLGKSTAIKVLAGGDDFFSDGTDIFVRSARGVQEDCIGVWLYEIPEIDLVLEDERAARRVKGFVSRTHDKARPAWGRTVVNRGRRFIFVATCNSDNYLIPEVGYRRFWPVTVRKIDLEALKRDRDQLWAEAVEAEATGEDLMIDQSLWGVANKRADERRVIDPWEDILARVESSPSVLRKLSIERGESRVASNYLFSHFLNLNPANVKVPESKRVATIMRRLGWDGPRVLNINGEDARGYRKPLADGVFIYRFQITTREYTCL